MSSETNTLAAIGVGGRLNWLVGGALGGLVGAVLFGGLLWVVDPELVTDAIPQTYGFESGGPTGWAFHLVHGVVLGVVFGFLITRKPILGTLTADVETPILASLGPNGRIVLAGLVYGLAIWVLLPGVILSILVTVGDVNDLFPWASILNLVGHLLYGMLLGALVSVFVDLHAEASEATAPFEEATDSSTRP